MKDTDFLNINAGISKIYNMHPAFGDLNGDGKADLLLGDNNGKIHYFQNTSSGSTLSFNRVSDDYFQIFCGVYAKPAIADLNKDGKPDLLIGRRNGTLAYYQNTGTASSAQFSTSPSIDSIGGVLAGEPYGPGLPVYCFSGCYASPTVTDVDGDGKPEIFVGSQIGRVFMYSDVSLQAGSTFKQAEQIFRNDQTENYAALHFGYNSNVAAADLNGDSIVDLMIGNERGGLRFFAGSRKTGSIHDATMQSNVKLFPNPADKLIEIELPANGHYSGEILNLLGAKVMDLSLDTPDQRIDISSLPEGIFLLQLNGSHARINSKFVIAR
jgi:hypothetical protein